MVATYILIGIFAGFIAGFWLRHQFDFIKYRDDSVFNKKKKAAEPEKKPHGTNIPVQTNRHTRHITKRHSGMDEPK